MRILVKGFGEQGARPEGPRLEAPRAEGGDGFFCGAAVIPIPSPPAGWSGERCKLPCSGVKHSG